MMKPIIHSRAKVGIRVSNYKFFLKPNEKNTNFKKFSPKLEKRFRTKIN